MQKGEGYKLTDAQATYVDEYLTNGHNKTAAARIAYPAATDDSIRGFVNNCNKSPNVQTALKERLGRTLRRYEITQQRIIDELSCIAFLDIKDLIADDHTLKPISEMPEEARRALAGMDIKELFERRGKETDYVGELKKFKVNSKEKALELLGKYLSMFTDKVEHDHKGEVNHNMNIKAFDLEERIAQLSEQVKVNSEVLNSALQ